jgi:predicted nucleic acid-binding protein
LNNSRAVIDANISIFKLIPGPQTPLALKLWDELQNERVSLHAPRLWIYELTSTLQKYLLAGQISDSEKERAIQTAFDMHIEFAVDIPALCTSAISWAKRINQMVAYDGFYLATAEQLDAYFWTADRRLATAAKALGVDWVHWMGDLE